MSDIEAIRRAEQERQARGDQLRMQTEQEQRDYVLRQEQNAEVARLNVEAERRRQQGG